MIKTEELAKNRLFVFVLNNRLTNFLGLMKIISVIIF